MNRRARRAAAAHQASSPSGVVRIQAASVTLPDGFHLDVPADICLDFAHKLVRKLERQEPVTTMVLSAGEHSWRWTSAS